MKFGTDGIRGVFGKELQPKHAYILGKILGNWAKQDKTHQKEPKIIIGRDTRSSGKLLEAALVYGICSTGTNAECFGVLPTPAISFYMQNSGASFGVSITASHNPSEHNGLKIFLPSGTKLSKVKESQIEEQLEKDSEFDSLGEVIGKITSKKPTKYTEYIKNNLPRGKQKIALDCSNGALYDLAPKVFQQMGYKVVLVGAHPNGNNINHGCGSTNPNLLKKITVKHKCFMGFGFDGDGDRIVAVTGSGNILCGDQLLFILAKLLKHEKRKITGVISTILSSSSLNGALASLGLNHITTDVGDKNVKDKMDEYNYILGGENSGHIIIGDKGQTGDGLLTATELVRATQILNKNLDELSSGFVPLCQYSLNVSGKINGLSQAIQAAEELNNNQRTERVIIRKSGTENVIRIFAEADSKSRAKELATYFQSVLISDFN